MFLSVAYDREGHIRIYANEVNGTLHCTNALTLHNVQNYLTLIMDAIMAWDDPLKVTHWQLVEKGAASSPGTPRNAVGFNDTHREIWVKKYDVDNRLRFEELLETGGRMVIATTFVITLSKLFLTNLEATLESQKTMTFVNDPIKKRGVKNV